MNKKIVILIIALINLTGCTAGFVKPDAGSPTMADTYQAAARGDNTFYQKNGNLQKSSTKLPNINTSVLPQYASVLDSQFPKLPNPENLMYIFGHYADQGNVPVPGHFVTFSMYIKDHYALPQEIQTPYNDGQFTR